MTEFKPTMTAPPKSVVKYSPTIPVSLKRQAESVVIERAKELCQRHPDIPDLAPLAESIGVLKKLEG